MPASVRLPVPAFSSEPDPLIVVRIILKAREIEGQRGVVEDAADAGQGAVIAARAVAELERAGGDRRAAGIGVWLRQGQRARARLDQAAGPADGRRQGLRPGEIRRPERSC